MLDEVAGRIYSSSQAKAHRLAQEIQTVNEKSQREKAEEWLDLNLSRFPHEDGGNVRVMNAQCQEMFDKTLEHAKDPKYKDIASSLLERAKGIVEALAMHDQLDWQTYRAYRAQISAAGLIVSAAELNPTA